YSHFMASKSGRTARHKQAAGVRRVDGEEAVHQAPGQAVVDVDVGAATLARRRQDHELAVTAAADRADANPAGKALVVGEEAEHLSAEELTEDGHVRTPARPCPSDDVGPAEIIGAAGSHVDPARKAGVEGEETVHDAESRPVIDDDVWTAAGPGA